MIVDKHEFVFMGLKCHFRCAKYSNGRLAIQALAEGGIPLGVLTVNLPDEELGAGEFFVKTWSENETFSECALKTGLFEDTGKRISTGQAQAQVWKLAKEVEER